MRISISVDDKGIASVAKEPSQNEKLLRQLFTEFVRLRETNHAPEEAWRKTQEVQTVDRDTRRHLAAMVQLWETRNGHRYKTASGMDIHTTAAMPAVKAPSPPPVTDAKRPDAHIFRLTDTLLLDIPNHPIRLQLADNEEVVVGRAAAASILTPDVDLSEFSDHGISRVHASMRRQATTLYITDLGSRNKTQLNNEALTPNTPHTLKHGDEVRFGTLAVRIRFERTTL